MSVHGEFGRALEAVIDALGASARPRGRTWRDGLEAARLGGQPDLSHAARTALAICDEIARDDAPEARIADVADHLERHCRAILGLSARADD